MWSSTGPCFQPITYLVNRQYLHITLPDILTTQSSLQFTNLPSPFRIYIHTLLAVCTLAEYLLIRRDSHICVSSVSSLGFSILLKDCSTCWLQGLRVEPRIQYKYLQITIWEIFYLFCIYSPIQLVLPCVAHSLHLELYLLLQGLIWALK